MTRVANSSDKPVSANAIVDALAELPEDFMRDGRGDTPPKEREFSRFEGLRVENWVST